jgi:hypothetical protein
MSTGIDVVGWRACAKQVELGPKRFATLLKKIGRQAADARALGPASSAVAVTPEQRRRLQVQQELRQALAQFDQGTPECKACPISDGKPFGCYTAIDFPIDADAETALFRYFAAQLDAERSTGAVLYRDVVSKVPQGTAWHTDRGPAGTLSELETAIVKEWGFLLWKKRVDSAQLLASLFFTQRRTGLISALAQFWEGFVKEARATAPSFDGSKTLLALEALSALYDRVLELASTTEGIHVLVESDAPPVAGARDPGE